MTVNGAREKDTDFRVRSGGSKMLASAGYAVGALSVSKKAVECVFTVCLAFESKVTNGRTRLRV